MEGDLEARSGAQSRVSSAASSHVNEEEVTDQVKASPTSLVSLQAYSSVYCPSRAHFRDIIVIEQGCCFY